MFQDCLQFRSRQPDACHGQQVVGNHTAADVLLEASPARPGTTVEPKGPLEYGNPSLDSGSEIPQALVDPVAFGHRQNGKPAPLGKDGILDLVRLGEVQIVLGGEPAVGAHLARHAPQKLLLALKEHLVTITVRRIARLDETIENQGRWATSEKHFVAVGGVPLPLDDNVAVLLEKRR